VPVLASPVHHLYASYQEQAAQGAVPFTSPFGALHHAAPHLAAVNVPALAEYLKERRSTGNLYLVRCPAGSLLRAYWPPPALSLVWLAGRQAGKQAGASLWPAALL